MLQRCHLLWWWRPQSLLWSEGSARDVAAMSQQSKNQAGPGWRQCHALSRDNPNPPLLWWSKAFFWWKSHSKREFLHFSITCSPPVMWLCSHWTWKGKVPALEELSASHLPHRTIPAAVIKEESVKHQLRLWATLLSQQTGVKLSEWKKIMSQRQNSINSHHRKS